MSLYIEGKKLGSSTILLREFMRRDPEAYTEEYYKYITHWETMVPLIKAKEVELDIEDITETISVIFSVCAKMHKGIPERLFHAAADLIAPFTENLDDSQKPPLSPKIMRALLQGIMLLRSRSLLPAALTLPFFFDLLCVKDKEARRMLLWHITSDIVRMNAKSKSVTENKRLQCILHKMVQLNDGHRSRHALSLLIELYRRKIWNTELPVFFISEGVFLKSNTFCIKIALYFLLSHPLSFREAEEDPSEGKEDPGKRISLLKESFQFRKKTRGREDKLKRTIGEISKDYNDDDEDDRKTEHKKIEPQFDPLLLLRDPQDFAERLLKLVQRTTELFDVRLLMLKLLSKLIALHQLELLPFYSYLQRYMQPYQRDISTILALCTESFHELIPPEELMPLVKTIANHFIHERSSPDSITIAISTIREMCRKQPLIMDKEFLSDLAEYSKYREDKGVSMAAKSLIKLFREIQPNMLPPKYRSRQANIGATIQPFASRVTPDTIPGLDQLKPSAIQDANGSDSESDSECSASASSDDGLDVSVDLDSASDAAVEDDDEECSAEEMSEALESDDAAVGGEESEEVEVSDDEADADVPQATEENRTVIPLYDHVFTDAEFRALKQINQAKQKNAKLKDAPIFVDSSIIEEFSTTARADRKEEKLEKIRESRKGHSIGARKKRRKGSSSHSEKKKTKLFQMSMRSGRVGKRLKQSIHTRNTRAKNNAQKNIKFRIRRGYKA